jgi:hypothetical protein
MEIPEDNNVYGFLECVGRIEELTELVRNHLALTASEIWLKRSQFDGAETIIIRSKKADFNAYKGMADGELLFNGSVAGNDQEVQRFVQELHRALTTAGFRPRFEIYDENKNCLGQFDLEPEGTFKRH